MARLLHREHPRAAVCAPDRAVGRSFLTGGVARQYHRALLYRRDGRVVEGAPLLRV